MTLDQLRVFAEVAETGSFSAAAERLHRAQSAVSYAIAKLEASLDVALFDRSGHRPALTEQGAALLGDARAVAARVEALRFRARALSSGTEARLGLAVDVMFPIDALLQQLTELQRTFPHVDLEVHTESLGGVAQLVLDGRCDLGIGMSFGQIPSALQWLAAMTLPATAVVSADHPLAALEPGASTELLAEHVQIVLTDRSALTEGQQRGVFSTRVWRVAELHTKRALLLAGFGWGTMPLHLVQDDLHAGRLVVVPAGLFRRPVQLQLHAMWRRRDPLGPVGRWVLERLVPGAAIGPALDAPAPTRPR